MLRDLSDTLAFVQVVKRGSFTAAAASLKTSKARISNKVRELELRLGAQLLYRSTRSLQLTEVGAVYYRHCQHLDEIIANAESAVGEVHEKLSGWLHVTAPHWLVTNALIPLLVRFRDVHPGIRLRLHLDHEVNDLVEEDFDVACRLWYGQMPDSSLTARRIAEIPTGLYASREYLSQAGTPSDPSELQNHACLVTQYHFDRPTQSWPLHGKNQSVDFSINPVVVASDPGALYELLKKGQGIQLTNEMLVRQDVSEGRVIRILLEWSGSDAILYAVRAGGRVQPAKVRAFMEFLAENFSKE
jgi:DNA-binding transcriptional LysR family regulator